jgi:hypothetical protein
MKHPRPSRAVLAGPAILLGSAGAGCAPKTWPVSAPTPDRVSPEILRLHRGIATTPIDLCGAPRRAPPYTCVCG